MVTTWTKVSKVGNCCGVQQSTVVYLSSVSQCQSTNFLVGNHRHFSFFFFWLEFTEKQSVLTFSHASPTPVCLHPADLLSILPGGMLPASALVCVLLLNLDTCERRRLLGATFVIFFFEAFMEHRQKDSKVEEIERK